MGVFDNNLSNKKYNDAKPNYDIDDGVDSVKCESNDCTNCRFRDIKDNRCLFETCILKVFPFSIPYHTEFNYRCSVCEKECVRVYDDNTVHPLLHNTQICDNCLRKLRKLINLMEDDNE